MLVKISKTNMILFESTRVFYSWQQLCATIEALYFISITLKVFEVFLNLTRSLKTNWSKLCRSGFILFLSIQYYKPWKDFSSESVCKLEANRRTNVSKQRGAAAGKKRVFDSRLLIRFPLVPWTHRKRTVRGLEFCRVLTFRPSGCAFTLIIGYSKYDISTVV